MELPKGIIPAIRQMKDFEKALETDHQTIVFLETRLAQLKSLVKYAKREHKQVLLHFDLIQGLKADEYGMEFLIRDIKPDGIISTRGNIIKLAKKHKLFAIQRMFLLDSMAVEHNLKLIDRFQPDCIELLPGLIPDIIQEIDKESGVPVIAGGLIRNNEEVSSALSAGAIAVSTSNTELWDT
ncbi:glycerol-3-phosphate responsive antiterminator [Lentibacillus salicampi]|uniref:Glycerol uptake operon antiterminator regulatory protein n=1 Tax=Lentibacillus salicampi TaxID=175306 RepID=A0A4Y9ADD5_9BACI|nr:glycerol-3-phosphate responsive antiterminator [Lentibacillus salicampi]TFJ93332.1 glycerol-3-phosphate responsive antiterminator [Lentibacillus salicampi]